MDSLFAIAVEAARALDPRFSDLLIHASEHGSHARVRSEQQAIVDVSLPVNPSQADWMAAARSALPLAGAWERFDSGGDVDFSVPVDGELIRVCLARAWGGIALVLRQRRGRAPDLADIGLPIDVSPWLGKSNGLILVCGPTGAGKSTTLAAMVEHINAHRHGHFVTVEDPIEYLFKDGRCIFTQRSVGGDVSDFARGVRAAMRQAPQFLLVGEIRDAETLRAALQLGESGQLVLATMHATNCERAIERIEALAGDQRDLVRSQLAGSLIGVIAQSLLPRLGGGRVLAAEVMAVTHAIAASIRGGKLVDIRGAMRNPPEPGSQVRMAMSLAALVRDGSLAREDALAVAYDTEEFNSVLSSRRDLPSGLGGRVRREGHDET